MSFLSVAIIMPVSLLASVPFISMLLSSSLFKVLISPALTALKYLLVSIFDSDKSSFKMLLMVFKFWLPHPFKIHDMIRIAKRKYDLTIVINIGLNNIDYSFF